MPGGRPREPSRGVLSMGASARRGTWLLQGHIMGTQHFPGWCREGPPLCEALSQEGTRSWRSQEAGEGRRPAEMGQGAGQAAMQAGKHPYTSSPPCTPEAAPRRPKGTSLHSVPSRVCVSPTTSRASASGFPGRPGGPHRLRAALHAQGPTRPCRSCRHPCPAVWPPLPGYTGGSSGPWGSYSCRKAEPPSRESIFLSVQRGRL